MSPKASQDRLASLETAFCYINAYIVGAIMGAMLVASYRLQSVEILLMVWIIGIVGISERLK